MSEDQAKEVEAHNLYFRAEYRVLYDSYELLACSFRHGKDSRTPI